MDRKRTAQAYRTIFKRNKKSKYEESKINK